MLKVEWIFFCYSLSFLARNWVLKTQERGRFTIKNNFSSRQYTAHAHAYFYIENCETVVKSKIEDWNDCMVIILLLSVKPYRYPYWKDKGDSHVFQDCMQIHRCCFFYMGQMVSVSLWIFYYFFLEKSKDLCSKRQTTSIDTYCVTLQYLANVVGI